VSNSLAIATVTASLKNLLQSAFNSNLADHLDGAEVTTQSPTDRGTTRGANIYMYQASPNAALRNTALPARNGDGNTVQAPQVALDLHYIVSFYGSDALFEPQRLMGIAVRTLNAQPVLSRRIVSQTVQAAAAQGSGVEFLGGSDLADGPAVVRLTQAEISLEELSKLWSVLLQTKYVLSVLYVASVVLIDSPESAVSALPVLQRNLSVNPVRMLAAERVASVNVAQPIVAGSQIAVIGSGLSAPGVAVVIDGSRQALTFSVQTDKQLEFALPAGLRAGAHTLRVGTFLQTSVLPTSESNLLTFLVHPTISGAITKTSTPATTPGLHNGSLSVPVTPRVAKTQSVSLLLTRKAPTSGPQPPPATSDGVVLSLHPALDDTSDTSTLVFPFTGLPSGVYAVRLLVDGAESPVTPASPPGTGLGPEATIP
jgi:hypothetical protein